DELTKIINLDFYQYLTEEKPYLTSGQVFSLISQGFHFGSHSCDHPEYRFLSLEEQLKQTKKSTEYICNKFSLNYKTFAFPFTDYGVTKDFFDAVYKKEKFLDISFGCAGIKTDSTPLHIQRVPFEMNNLSAKE